MSFSSGQQCINFISNFTSKPPQEVFFLIPSLRKCRFYLPKILVRVTSLTNPLDWDGVFTYRKKQWHAIGGNKIKPAMTRKVLSPSEVATWICQALVNRKGKARLEVDISIGSEDPKCDYTEWDTSTDLAVVRGTRMSYTVQNPTILYFNQSTTFPASMFECTSTELKFIYDFSTQKRISIWDPKEIKFQESAAYARRW